MQTSQASTINWIDKKYDRLNKYLFNTQPNGLPIKK